MKSTRQNTLNAALLFIGAGIIAACSTPKNTALNRGLQNMSARYNYIYNSGVLLTEYENTYALSISDTYETILPVYLMPKGDAAIADKSLTAINAKAQAIISEKNVSNYLDDAYVLLGKASYYQGNFFTATEYFDYVAKSFPADKKNKLRFINAMAWKARSQYMLGNFKEARQILDTVQQQLDAVKKGKAEALATLAQINIRQNQYSTAITQLQAALKQDHTSQETSRWNYIIGQLYEAEKNYAAALNYYTKVAKSNAPFEMYFHANLNRIRVRGLLNGEQLNKEEQLLALLKDDKNEEYTDQIYYKVAENYAERGNTAKAEEYYLLSISKSTRNQYQKGLSYLKVGDINFINRGDYLKAKAYYDSAVTTLPKTYPGYELILKKDQNLQYLGDRYKIISMQDTLQMLAALPENERLDRINKILGPEIKTETVKKPAAATTDQSRNFGDPFSSENVAATFYFNNAAALSNGFSDFKRKWGNRTLQDNWRQSTRTASQTVTQNQDAAIVNPVDTTSTTAAPTERIAQARAYLDNLPLTAAQVQASNQKIIDTYFEIASFYQQELGDKKEAARIYELILKRFPENSGKETIYYSLYRAYQDVDDANSEKYKALVLKEFPNSVFAKTILDPSYSVKASAMEAAIQRNYNQAYGSYVEHKYDQVIAQADVAIKAFPGNALLSQYDYLRAIAIGRTNNVDSLMIVFNEIVNRYPDDKVITPLVKSHIEYIKKNIYEFRTRLYALADFDSKNTLFASQFVPDVPVTQPATQPVVQPPKKEEEKTVAITPPPADPPVTNPPVTTPQVTKPEENVIKTENGIKTDGTFTNAPSNLYYYVVRVNDASLTLSSSRFGIGQFNRGNFPDDNLKHQLNELDDDQLIFVGNFPTFEAVKRYSELINPQLSRIMKVPAANYSAFIISKENYDKLDTREKITQYLKFYQNSY